MSLRWSDIVDGLPAPSLATVRVEAQEAILAMVVETVDAAMFGGEDAATYKRAAALLAAHHAELALHAASGQSGPVVSKSADGLSKSFATWGSTSDPLDRTAWGQAFKQMARNSGARAGLSI